MEAVDPVFQAKMLDMLKQTGRPEMVVGWYHSHPGFGCWLSGVDINTQQSFETLSTRAVAVVVDPIQSVKGEGGREGGVPHEIELNVKESQYKKTKFNNRAQCKNAISVLCCHVPFNSNLMVCMTLFCVQSSQV